MRPRSISIPEKLAIPAQSGVHTVKRDERAYRGVTIVAVLWLLASLWLFR
jgi:hypothetical protein